MKGAWEIIFGPRAFMSVAALLQWERHVNRRIDARRETLAGKPWKRGGNQTIRQRRALAFANRRRN